MKSKVISIILFFCLLAPIVATLSFLKFHKEQLRKELKVKIVAGIDKHELVFFKFSKEKLMTLSWWKDSDEFEYNGQMYDVVEKQVKGDTIYYWCWWDYKETKLNKQLDELVTNSLNKNAKRKDSQKKLVNFFNSLYLPEELNLFFVFPKKIKSRFNYRFSYCICYFLPPNPPPDIS